MNNEKPPKTEEKRPAGKLSLADLIAQTPGAQPRAQLIDRINARQQRHPKKQSNPAPAEEQLTEREPLPIPDDLAHIHEDPDQFAAGFFKRRQVEARAKQKPPRRSKPRIVVDNDKPSPPDKK